MLWVPWLIGDREKPGAHCPESLVPSCFYHVILPSVNFAKPWPVLRLRVELNGSAFAVKLGRTKLWDDHISFEMAIHYPIGSPEFLNNS